MKRRKRNRQEFLTIVWKEDVGMQLMKLATNQRMSWEEGGNRLYESQRSKLQEA